MLTHVLCVQDSIQVHLKGGKGPITVWACDIGTRDVTEEKSGCFLTLEESRIKTAVLHRGRMWGGSGNLVVTSVMNHSQCRFSFLFFNMHSHQLTTRRRQRSSQATHTPGRTTEAQRDHVQVAEGSEVSLSVTDGAHRIFQNY